MTYHTVVRDHLAGARAYLAVGPSRCLGLPPTGSGTMLAQLTRLDEVDPSGSWLLACMLCPGDDTTHLTSWAKLHRIASDRVHFFLHPRVPVEALRPWVAAGFTIPQLEMVTSWDQVMHAVRLAVLDRVFTDAAEIRRQVGRRRSG